MIKKEDLNKGTNYRITIPLTFDGVFSHFVEKDGVECAAFETPGVNRFGKTYRTVPVESILRLMSDA